MLFAKQKPQPRVEGFARVPGTQAALRAEEAKAKKVSPRPVFDGEDLELPSYMEYGEKNPPPAYVP